MKTSIAIVDDHYLMAQALAGLIDRFESYEVIFCAQNGRDFIYQLSQHSRPDILIVDVHMASIDSHETARYVRDHHPDTKMLALSKSEDEQTIAQMIQYGVHGYLPKCYRSSDLRLALDDIRSKGYHYSDFLTKSLITQLKQPAPANAKSQLKKRESEFIRWACSELTYVEVADKMCVSPRTVDGYREAVFEKLGVKSRQGLVMEAIRRKLV
ncbi:response regulator transcription factor [Fibrivirga algicola]|uniref:Response regulator transcription factor n=1 Tax=Fibrivirga algicola TaxID=2950420 RepID=A0ABX0QB20_9BACT|nr:response regulator transcription factor [Fibrivirga algicola]ARK13166.1 DNA-binding response regulator [Fibrella sp. ES10-3-2-2]NID09244.1 response regulator transcription factor [Fibrivirga algicola]